MKVLSWTLLLSALLVGCGAQHGSDGGGSDALANAVVPKPTEEEASSTNVEAVTEDSAGQSYALKDIDMARLVSVSKSYLGVPYKFDADPYPDSKRFDCSSYTKYIFAKFGVSLPRSASEQSKVGEAVARANLKVGDLVFFKIPTRAVAIGHVGIYIGGGNMINANTAGKGGVQITNINAKEYWDSNYRKARRVAR